MEQKRVSFKVAKAIKEAGYPQYPGENYWWKEGSYLSEHTEPSVEIYKGDNYYDYRQNLYYAPSYIDVWLWREKGIEIELCGNADQRLGDYYKQLKKSELDLDGEINMIFDPEDSIIITIDYLVDNDLIK